MKKKFFLSCLLIVMALLPAVAQIQDPVQFKTELKTISDTEAQIVFTGKIDAGWHVYSTDLPSGGPISATFNVDKIEGVELVGKLTPQGKEIENFDKVFEMKLRYFENTAIFIQKLKITGATYMIEGYMEFGACNDENCLPPTEVSFSFSGKGVAAATTSNVVLMFYFLELPDAEIAEILDISRNSVYRNRMCSLKLIRDMYEEEL